jgi:hypothetical protein
LIVYPNPTEYILTRDHITGVYFNPMRSHDYLWKDIAKN